MEKGSWAGKRVLITGVCGTVGRELMRQVLAREPDEVIGIDNNESGLFFSSQAYRDKPEVHLQLGDVRDRSTLHKQMEGVDIVLHAAGLKHVILCEESPRDAVHTNILGVQNVVDGAVANDVERVVFTSSDKAVNPTSVMGTSKLMAERLLTAANSRRRNQRPIFSAVRFGNVLGSRGSVIPIFRKQIAVGGPVTLTDRRMTRFIMTLEDAVTQVMDAVFLARGGEVFVTRMPVIRIEDLAYVMIDELAPRFGHEPSDIEVDIIGAKAGEKLYEELVNEEETRRTLSLERYFVVTPAFTSVFEDVEYDYPNVMSRSLERAYNSSTEDPMTRTELGAFLREHNLLRAEFPSSEEVS